MMKHRLLAGVGKADITVEPGAIIGDLLTEKAKPHIPREFWDKKIEIDDPLFVKALVLDDGSSKLALITMDVTAVGCRTTSQNILDDSADDFLPNLRGCLSKELGIRPAHVSVCASHTHEPGPTLCSDQEQLRRTVQAVKQALQNMTSVAIGVGSIQDKRLTVNRTCRQKNGLHSCGRLPEQEVESLGPVDTEIGVIRIDRLDGRPLAVVYNFASHILYSSPNDNVTAGFPGVTSDFLEKNLGGGTMAFFIQGAFGDVMEVCLPYNEKVNPRSPCETGLMLAQSVLEAYRKIEPSPASLQVVSTTVEFPLRNDIPKGIAALRRQQAELTAALDLLSLNFESFLPLYLQYALHPEFPTHPAMRYLHADQTGDPAVRSMDRRNRIDVERYLGNVRHMEEIARAEFKIRTLQKHQEIIDTLGGKTVSAEIQGIKIGGCVLIAAPMEVLTEVGLNVKKNSPFRHTYIVSIANGYLHYSPPASYYPLGSYEATECLLAPEWEAIFYRVVQDLFDQLQAKG
ncbi:MAG: hypothetical protein HY360_02280 [Verrucomicrobia bacterium]|nr:hypothetical protein [Verrucomicrobiota bacterium]